MAALRVIVIDDNEAHASGLAELLELSGFEASYATNGLSGLERLAHGAVDAVLLDVHLPDMNGYEVCQRIRRDRELAHVAVVFHSGSEPVDSPHGADAFLTYPVEMKHVRNVIQGCVARRKKAGSHGFIAGAQGAAFGAAGVLGLPR